MKPACQCRASSSSSRMTKRRRGLAWLLPGAGLALVPKCPACLAAWMAVAFGAGITPGTASTLHSGLIALCAGPPFLYIAYLIFRRHFFSRPPQPDSRSRSS